MDDAKLITVSPDGKDRLYLSKNGLHIRDVVIDAGIGEETVIGFLTDLHYNYCNARDFDEADPVVMSTLANRHWLAGGASVPVVRRCLTFLEGVDQLVLGGDTLDYLSHGAMELMQREIWDRYPDTVAVVGGHELARKMQGTVAETLSRDERLAMVEAFWKHDIHYTSRLIKEKVLVVSLFNDLSCFDLQQYSKLAADIALARENSWIILLFAHEPIATQDPKHQNITQKDAIQVGDPSGFPFNYCDGKLAGGKNSDPATRAVHELIVSSADVVRGFFAGHVHSHLHLEIGARLPDGSPATIPQFIQTTAAYQDGHLMRVTVR